MRERLEGRSDVDYQVARSNEQWIDHQARTLATGALIAWQKPDSILDPACGDGSIVLASMKHHNPKRVLLDDMISHGGKFDMIVLTETLEHLEEPDATLALARDHADILIASSPEMRLGQMDGNPEHLWMFDGGGYHDMLAAAGWAVVQKTHLAFPGLMYDFGIWVCR